MTSYIIYLYIGKYWLEGLYMGLEFIEGKGDHKRLAVAAFHVVSEGLQHCSGSSVAVGHCPMFKSPNVWLEVFLPDIFLAGSLPHVLFSIESLCGMVEPVTGVIYILKPADEVDWLSWLIYGPFLVSGSPS